MNRPVVVHIGALELVGIPEGRKHAVASAFERELARRLTEAPLPAGISDAPELALPQLRVHPNAPSHRIGVALAHAVHRALVGEPSGGLEGDR